MSVAQKRKVLVLNKGWNAIGVVSLERAIVMLFSTHECGTPKAKIIDPTREFQTFTWADWSRIKPKMDEETIRSANMVFRVPEVILLSKYDKMPQHKIHFSRRTIYRRDGNQCQYCGCTPGTEELTIDHVIPRWAGGPHTWDNTVACCRRCNLKKGDKTPQQARMPLARKPRRPHFVPYLSLPVYLRAQGIEDWRMYLPIFEEFGEVLN